MIQRTSAIPRLTAAARKATLGFAAPRLRSGRLRCFAAVVTARWLRGFAFACSPSRRLRVARAGFGFRVSEAVSRPPCSSLSRRSACAARRGSSPLCPAGRGFLGRWAAAAHAFGSLFGCRFAAYIVWLASRKCRGSAAPRPSPPCLYVPSVNLSRGAGFALMADKVKFRNASRSRNLGGRGALSMSPAIVFFCQT